MIGLHEASGGATIQAAVNRTTAPDPAQYAPVAALAGLLRKHHQAKAPISAREDEAHIPKAMPGRSRVPRHESPGRFGIFPKSTALARAFCRCADWPGTVLRIADDPELRVLIPARIDRQHRPDDLRSDCHRFRVLRHRDALPRAPLQGLRSGDGAKIAQVRPCRPPIIRAQLHPEKPGNLMRKGVKSEN